MPGPVKTLDPADRAAAALRRHALPRGAVLGCEEVVTLRVVCGLLVAACSLRRGGVWWLESPFCLLCSAFACGLFVGGSVPSSLGQRVKGSPLRQHPDGCVWRQQPG